MVDEAAAERTLLEPHSPSEPRKFGQGLRAMHWGAGGGMANEAVVKKKAYSDELQRQIRERKVPLFAFALFYSAGGSSPQPIPQAARGRARPPCRHLKSQSC